MNNKNTIENLPEFYDLYPSGRNPKVLRSAKGYDRVKDRKDQRLFEYEYDTEDEEFFDEIE